MKVKIEPINDKGNEVGAQKISSDLAERNDTLMVVGHFYSMQTKAALPNYLQADPPIPVILTTETNPHLVLPKVSRYEYLKPQGSHRVFVKHFSGKVYID